MLYICRIRIFMLYICRIRICVVRMRISNSFYLWMPSCPTRGCRCGCPKLGIKLNGLTATPGTTHIKVCAGHVYFLLHQREKKLSTILYGYRKCGTHARVFSQTLAHGICKNERKNETDEVGKKRGVSMETSKAGTKERSPGGLSLPNKNKKRIKIKLYFKRYGKEQWNSIHKKTK